MPDATPVVKVARVKRKRFSKVLWFNLAMTLVAALEMHMHLLQPLLPVDVYQALLFVVLVGNKVLRFYTSTALAWPGRKNGGAS